MKKISSKASTSLSIGATFGLLAILLGTLFFIPTIVIIMVKVHLSSYEVLKLFFTVPIDLSFNTLVMITTIIVYILNALGLVTGVLLLLILLNVKKDSIFVFNNVSYLRACSWLCIIAGLLFFTLGSVYWTCLLLGFAAELVGLMLRVVKNIIERAVEIKEENDLTI